MRRVTAASLAASVLLQFVVPAARAQAQAAAPFKVVPIETPTRHSHVWAYVTLVGGAGLVGASFAFARRADDAYAQYLVTTDVPSIETLYDRAVRFDHLSHASLLTGETMIAAGLYLRFIRRPPSARLSLSLEPSRCAVSCRF
jgi:hypothetical protein